MGLTQKERATAQIQHWETDFIPYTISFEGDVAERLDAYYGDQQMSDGPTMAPGAIRNPPGVPRD
jgi:hypothetical protein